METVYRIIKMLSSTTKTSEKRAILESVRGNELFKKICAYAYNGDKYNLSPSQVDKESNCIPFSSYKSMFDLLDDLKNRNISGNMAVTECSCYCDEHPVEADIFLKILDHDLGCGINRGLISKVWPDIFSTFSVALADRYSDKTEKCVNLTECDWYVSRKLDGVRCICIKEGDEVHFYARSGKEFKTLDRLREDVLKLSGDFVLDGECCVVDENGDEDFISIISEIKRKNWTIEKPMYQVFDCLTIDEFKSCKGEVKFSERQNRYTVQEIANKLSSSDITRLCLVRQSKLESNGDIDRWSETAASNGWEGVMLRKDVKYEGKRTNSMLKVKKFQDAEYVVVGCSNDVMRLVIDGRQKEVEVLANIDIEHKGNIVSVGSGFSKEQRIHYSNKHDELIGKTVTIKYFQESRNADGKWSLRFPTVKCIYDETRDV